jgi:small-conductance mechanosensitive channel
MSNIINTIYQSLLKLIDTGISRLPAFLAALVILLITRYAVKIVKKTTAKVAARTIHSKSLQILFTKFSEVTTWVFGILFACVLIFLGLRLGDVVATLGLSSVAIGFAFQDIFKNFLAGILLLLQEPFRIDDQIVIGDYEGTVEKINIRTTEIRSYQGEKISIPNATVFTSAVRVKTAFPFRRTDLGIGISYNTYLPTTVEILAQAIAEVTGVLEYPPVEIDIVAFGESSIDIVLRYWTEPRQQQVRQVQTRVIIRVKDVLEQHNIEIPYPIRTVYMQDSTNS